MSDFLSEEQRHLYTEYSAVRCRQQQDKLILAAEEGYHKSGTNSQNARLPNPTEIQPSCLPLFSSLPMLFRPCSINEEGTFLL